MKIYRIELTALCRRLSTALSAECSPIQAELLHELFIKRATAPDGEQRLWREGGECYVDVAYLYGTYADWVTDIGMALGYDCHDDEFAGEWITDDMPAVEQIMKDIRKAAVSGLDELDGRLKAEYGFSASDVFSRAVSAGESIEQSSVRLHSDMNGLRVVK